jgi:outer membrane protein TolC
MTLRLSSTLALAALAMSQFAICAAEGHEPAGRSAPPAAWSAPQRLPAVQVVASAAVLPAGVRQASFENAAQPAPMPPSNRREAHELPQPPELLDQAEVLAVPPTAAAFDGAPTLPLDFATALGMTQTQNPRIAFAQAQIAQAYAQSRSARVMWLPSLRAGMNYNKHEGRIQDVIGSNIETSRGAMYGGLGASAVGAGSPAIPGLYMQFHTTDAIFQRQIAGFALRARQSQSAAVTNDQLLETALCYLTLLDALQRNAIARETLRHGEALVNLTADFAATGAGNLADADRAGAATALLRNEVVRTEEAIATASARLAQQLSTDPAILIVPLEPTVIPIDLIPPEMADANLVATGLSNRPELAANRALVNEAVSRLQREKHAPWLPSIVLGMSYGAFGAGTGGDIEHAADRLDLDAVAWWEVRNLGFTEAAARANSSAQIQQARMREVETMDLVAREIVEAHAQVRARRRMITVAEEGIKSSQQSYDRNLERIRNAQGLPIEVLQSIQALDAARRDYLRSVTDYNQAQFRLQRALGWPVVAPYEIHPSASANT